MAGLVAVASTLAVQTSSSADTLSNLQSQAQALAAKIQSLGQQEDALSEKYDAAAIAVQQAQASVANAAASAQAAQNSAQQARAVVVTDAVDAYMNGGSAFGQTSNSSLANANESLLASEYVDTLAADQTDAMDSYQLANAEAHTAETNYQAQQAVAQQNANTLASDKAAVASTQAQLQSAYNQDQGQIKVLVAQAEAAAAAAAQQAAMQRILAAQAQQEFAGPPPPVGSGASGAVAAAESRIGSPYVWAAAGPGDFDCSGLIMWAYAQVGISLPHYSGDQYADTVHISMANLEPGDLVFPSDPGEHVAMYIGNGEVVQAPYTGALVSTAPLSSFFVLASRVE